MLAALIKLYLRTPLRGRTRLTLMLARHCKELQAVPIQIADWCPVYMDLRNAAAHEWWQGSPWKESRREVAEQRVMRAMVRPGDTVYDVGANLGLHAALLYRLVGPGGRLIVFEPNVELLLQRTLAGMPGAQLVPLALSDKAGEATLFVPDDDSMASLSEWSVKRHGAGYEVKCRTERLDQLRAEGAIAAPDFIKCDVEGAEPLVFEGARQTLDREDAPIVLFEANVHAATGFGKPISAGYDFLASLPRPRFHFFDIDESGGLKSLRELNLVHSNIVAVPESRQERIPAVV